MRLKVNLFFYLSILGCDSMHSKFIGEWREISGSSIVLSEEKQNVYNVIDIYRGSATGYLYIKKLRVEKIDDRYFYLIGKESSVDNNKPLLTYHDGQLVRNNGVSYKKIVPKKNGIYFPSFRVDSNDK